MWRMTLIALGFVAMSGPAAAQACGPPCQSCVSQLGVPRDGQGRPVFARVDRSAFRDCVQRVRQGGNRTGGNTRSAR